MALVPSLVDLEPWRDRWNPKWDMIKWDPWELDLYDHWKKIDSWFDYNWRSDPYWRDYWLKPYRYRSRWWYDQPIENNAREISTSLTARDGFLVKLDVSQYRPHEITVKTTPDNTIVIEGRTEAHPNPVSHVRKEFVKKYKLPADYNTWDVTSDLSPAGYLTVKCPPPLKPLPPTYDRFVPIKKN